MGNTNLIQVFTIMANAIAQKYTAKVQMATLEAGSKPSFENLMSELTDLQNELTKEGAKFIEDRASKPDVDKNTLTEDVKSVIMSTIQAFVKTL